MAWCSSEAKQHMGHFYGLVLTSEEHQAIEMTHELFNFRRRPSHKNDPCVV
jgi:hypothetical protein